MVHSFLFPILICVSSWLFFTCLLSVIILSKLLINDSFKSCNQASEVVVESSDHPESLTNKWQFGLFELASSHYASICMEKDKTSDVAMRVPMRLTVRKTIPFVEDICISGTDAVVPIAGLIKQVWLYNSILFSYHLFMWNCNAILFSYHKTFCTHVIWFVR